MVDGELQSGLQAVGAVVVEGPRACGKTATARQAAASEVLLDVDDNARRAIAVDPSLVLAGDVPRLIDEWQIEPSIWNHVRRAVDDRQAPAQFILTGSAVPPDDITRHTGAGRLARLRMRPMTLLEKGQSTGAVSLGDLLAGQAAATADPGLTVQQLAEEIVAGGWPGLRGLGSDRARQAVAGYLDEVSRSDVNRVDGRRRDVEKLRQLLRSVARNVATSASASTLAADTGGAEGPLKRDTVVDYLEVLSRLMVIEDQPAWAPRLRSRARLRNAPKRHFVDPSLAVAALGTDADGLLSDLNLLGLLFESLVVRDLRVYAQANSARVLQYRDSNNLEADAIVEGFGGKWAAIEVKIGAGQVEEGAKTLKRLANNIDQSKSGAPAALVVVTGTGYGYRRDDGVMAVPIGALGP